MSKHTPGPWTVDETVWEDGPCISGPDNKIHVQVFELNTGRKAKERAEANARLIAAAPEMLQELKMLVKGFFKHPKGCDCDTCAVIAKAEGKGIYWDSRRSCN